jgi:hypothetical protein
VIVFFGTKGEEVVYRESIAKEEWRLYTLVLTPPNNRFLSSPFVISLVYPRTTTAHTHDMLSIVMSQAGKLRTSIYFSDKNFNTAQTSPTGAMRLILFGF